MRVIIHHPVTRRADPDCLVGLVVGVIAFPFAAWVLSVAAIVVSPPPVIVKQVGTVLLGLACHDR